MPTYTTRSLQEYPAEFYRCPANPEGYEFACMFCMTFYRTKGDWISHMKTCCADEGVDYNDELEVEDGVTVYDCLRNHAAKSSTIKTYITTNALASLTDTPSSRIIEIIQMKLTENGFAGEESYLHNTSFLIYKFFFVASEEENSEFRRRCVERILSHI